MGRPRLDSFPGQEANVIVRRPMAFGDARNSSTGGVPFQGQVQQRPDRQNFNGRDLAPSISDDGLIQKDRQYLYRRANYNLPGDGGGNHSWTADGPSKDMPTTRFIRNIRPLVGGGHRDMWGQHTDYATIGANALVGKPRMRPAAKNNLTVQRYRGQSYSATTKLAGT
jgi:hypothetical protein